jgi:formamidopyrimidine-DNA glycosylase
VPELPDITAYVEALQERIVGRVLEGVRCVSPSLQRSVTPPLAATHGRRVVGVSRLGKRIVIELSDSLYLVLHLMIAGRLHWKPKGAALPRPRSHAAFDFAAGSIVLTEAGSHKRASLHVVEGEEAVRAHDRGGVDPLACDLVEFSRAVTAESHTLKRTLTDPTILSGIGNAYSDEILHRARLSPVALSTRLSPEQLESLFAACRTVLEEWIVRLRAERAGRFPERVTAFRPGMAVHGRYREPCPVCGSPVQRIVYASNETNYCATCQNGGVLLADRALSRLLKKDWPRTVEALEERMRGLPSSRT